VGKLYDTISMLRQRTVEARSGLIRRDSAGGYVVLGDRVDMPATAWGRAEKI
jgi:hypothetical protein